MFLNFLYRLRALQVPVGTSEAINLATALAAGLHGSSMTGFYHVARALLIHHEGHLDAFDRAFAAEFRGLETLDPSLTKELREWLDQAAAELSPAELADAEFLASLDLDELLKLFEQRKREQTERHDGGSRWIGTNGKSPFGQGGQFPGGLSTSRTPGSRTAAANIADARNYAGYRSDVTLDIRQLEVALRRLRAFVREGGQHELDIERTIDETARNAGEIEVVTRPPSRPNTHVILMVDVGGSMFPHSQLMSQLFSATKKATHFKELRTFAFHNCVYGKVYKSEVFTDPVWVHELIRECGPHYKLIMVGDALMAPYELGQRGAASAQDQSGVSGFDWLRILTDHFTDSVWLNPEPQSRWTGTTIDQIGTVFDMYPMTVSGLTEAMAHLNRGTSTRR